MPAKLGGLLLWTSILKTICGLSCLPASSSFIPWHLTLDLLQYPRWTGAARTRVRSPAQPNPKPVHRSRLLATEGGLTFADPWSSAHSMHVLRGTDIKVSLLDRRWRHT